MQELKWTPDYDVGVKQFNFHHQRIFGIINEFREALAKGEAKEIRKSILGSLSEYSDYHLKAEEDYFDKYEYDQANKHIKEHDAYRERIRFFLDRIDEEGIDEKIMAFLTTWWIHHILKIDMKYKKFFEDREVTE